MTSDPLVSIRCLVYNHEPYLRQCLEGFVMQQTTFAFEAIIHDDASTDGSADIIREYAEKYPDIIKPIYETENQYIKHDDSIKQAINAVAYPDSKYIATCEGDDFWTDPNKLQTQVDFLESHPDFFMTCHAFNTYYEDTKKYEPYPFLESLPVKRFNDREYCVPDIDDYFHTGWFTQWLTIVRRNRPFMDDCTISQYKVLYDYITCYYMLKAGKCALFKERMGVYRRHSSGVSTGRDEEKWYDDCLANYYTLYSLEKEESVLPLIDSIFKAKLGTYIKHLRFRDLVLLIGRHVKYVPISNISNDFIDVFIHAISKIFRKKGKDTGNDVKSAKMHFK